MLNIGLSEMLLIAVLVIVFVGPDDLPRLMRALGRNYAKLRQASDELRRAFTLEVDRVEAERRADEIRKRREELLARRKAQQALPPDGGPQGRLERSVGASKGAGGEASAAAEGAAEEGGRGAAAEGESTIEPVIAAPDLSATPEAPTPDLATPEPTATPPDAKQPASARRQGEPDGAEGIFPTGDLKPGEPRT